MAEKGLTFQENVHSTCWGKNHISENDSVFNEALLEMGINREFYTQAANSRDMNLGFFRVIQSFNDAALKK